MKRKRCVFVALLATAGLASLRPGPAAPPRPQTAPSRSAALPDGDPLWLRSSGRRDAVAKQPAAAAQAKSAAAAVQRTPSSTSFERTAARKLAAVEAAIAAMEGTAAPAVPAFYMHSASGDRAIAAAAPAAPAGSAGAAEGNPDAGAAARTDQELATLQAAIGAAQQRMSRAGVSFRIQAIAAAEQALQDALAQLQHAQSTPATPEDIAAAQQAAAAQAGLDDAQAQRALLDQSNPQPALAAAQQRLAVLSAPADAAAVAAAQARVAAAQAQLEQTAGTASANKTAAEAHMHTLAGEMAQAQARFDASVQQYDTAMHNIDPQTGEPLPQDEAEARQQQYAAAVAEYDRQLRAAEAELNVAYSEFEAARQQEINDVDAARRLLDDATAELARLMYGPSNDELAQAKTELAATVIAFATWQANLQAADTAVADAAAQLADATAVLNAAQSGATSTVAAAQQLVDEATTKLAITRQAGLDSSGWMWPTYGVISSGFGPRDMQAGRFHDGIDIAAGAGTPIAAARDGTVIEAGWCAGYGYCVKIAHDGAFNTEYGHLEGVPLVQAGQQLTAGTIVGRMGTTYDAAHGGYSTGIHLHFTIRLNGVAVDPLIYLP